MTTLGRERVMQTAEKLVARGKISQAIKEYRKLLREDPNDANMLNRIGDLYARQDKVDEAVELFQKIAEGYSRDGFFVKAIAIFKKIIRLDPTQLAVYERLAELYHRQGLVSESRSQYLVLVDYYTKHNDMSATIEIHRKMADLEPNDPSPRVKLAELYLREGLIEETIGEYQRIAELMLDHGRVEEATKVYVSALDVDSDDLAFVSEAVMRLREEGEQEAATRVFEAAVERNPAAAKLAERMREHETPELAEVEMAVGGPETAESPTDSVDMADLLNQVDVLEDSDQVSLRELDQIAASSDISGVDMTDEGAFVIGLEDEDLGEDVADQVDALAEEALKGRDRQPEAVDEELEIDLTALEDLAAAPKQSSDPTSVDISSAPPAEQPTATPPAVADSASIASDPAETQLSELLAEAEVFAKYGLESKARRRLEQALEIDSENFEAQSRLVMLHLEKGSEAEVVESAQHLLDREDVAGGKSWETVLGALSAAGYSIADGQIRAAGSQPDAAKVARRDSAATTSAETGTAAEVEEEGLEWLDTDAPKEKAEPDELFAVEEEFLDMTAEIEKELASAAASEVEALTDVGGSGDESLEDIVEGFKQGVAEVLSPDAYDTHYDLGIAYREMGLVDEAIGEFQLCAKDPEHLIDSCSMLGACFLEKGFPDLAVKWYKRGLEAPSISDEESLSLLYDLGSVYANGGEREAAYEVFVEIYGANSHYRDVVARLEELRSG